MASPRFQLSKTSHSSFARSLPHSLFPSSVSLLADDPSAFYKPDAAITVAPSS